MTIPHSVSAFSCPALYALFLFLSFLISPLSEAHAKADPAHFPHYRILSTNIDFWEKIFSTYSINTAIIHDQNDLSRVYGTVALVDQTVPDASKKNRLLTENAKKRYAHILHTLATNPRPHTQEEKKVASLFPKTATAAEYREAAENIRIQTGLKERFTEGVIRSGALMRELKRIFKSHGLPEDLVYLPHVESSFDPKAFSKFGASGMWQFTHSTGKNFLRIDYIIDERRDPLISAEAAALFLKRNYLLLGSWPLALTAYNYGTSGMMRARKQYGSYDKIFSHYRQGYFKFASRNFYSEFLAAVKVAKKLEGSGTLTLDRPVPFVSVKLPGFARSDALCAHLGIDEKTLRQFNPALREPVFKGTKFIPQGYLLKLPIRFQNSSLLTSVPPSVFSSGQKRSLFYQVRPGDTAGAIAHAHKISLQDLIQANNLNRLAMVRVGQNLRIPAPANKTNHTRETTASVSSGVILNDSKKTSPASLVQVIKQDSTVVGNLKVSDISKKNSLVSGTIEVQPDESVGIYADWLKATPESIRLSNGLTAQVEVLPGQKIALEFLNVSIESFEETRFDFHQETQEDFFNSYAIIGLTTYQVKQGDTLWDICHNMFDLPLWLLIKYNSSLDFNRLEPSSSLQIPVVKEI